MSQLGRLHLITDARPGRDPLPIVRAVLRVGVPVVQVRVGDHVTDREAYDLTRRILELCRAAGATCLVNDRLHIALAAGADGGMVGGDDLPVEAARRILGPTAILGATARDPQSAKEAVAAGASYLSVGPAFSARTQAGGPGQELGLTGIEAIVAAVPVPIIASGGVSLQTTPQLLAAGVHGVAVVAAISDASDPVAAAAHLLAVIGHSLPPPAAAA
jgi:thiamine-phosphate pyrophosphorylase